MNIVSELQLLLSLDVQEPTPKLGVYMATAGGSG